MLIILIAIVTKLYSTHDVSEMFVLVHRIIDFIAVKNFLSIHPTSVIAAHPDWVQGVGENVRKGMCYYCATCLSKSTRMLLLIVILIDDEAVERSLQHQLLCYLQLLETNKPYLLGITRVPGMTDFKPCIVDNRLIWDL